MNYVMVDVEADGPIPGDYSMVSFGAVLVDSAMKTTFYGKLRPISEKWLPRALAISGFTRDETMRFEDPVKVMREFKAWLGEVCGEGRPIFISDNGFDWQFINWYFHHFLGENPFRLRSANLGSLYKGVVRDTDQTFMHLRRTKHTHHPVDDAMGNVEALLTIIEKHDLKMAL